MLQVEKVLHHLLEMVGKMFRRVTIAFLSVFAAAVIIVEGVNFGLTLHFGSGLVHVVAVVIGFSLALNVALAVMIEEGLRGFLALIRELAKDAEQLAGRVAKEVVKDGGQVVQFAEHELQAAATGTGRLVQAVERGGASALQGLEHGAATAVRNAEQLPGRLIGGTEHAVQGLERRITGQADSPPPAN